VFILFFKQHNYADFIYLIFIQYDYMFRLSISAIIKLEYWFTKRVIVARPFLTNSGYKIT